MGGFDAALSELLNSLSGVFGTVSGYCVTVQEFVFKTVSLVVLISLSQSCGSGHFDGVGFF